MSRPMHCYEFLEHYSAYRDGLLTDAVLWEDLSRHLRSCPRCTRYDALVARGVRALRACDVEPSSAFRWRLKGRLTAAAAAAREPTVPKPAAGVFVGLCVIGASALLFWELAATDPPTPLAAVASEPPLPVVVANPGVPFVTFVPLSVPPVQGKPVPDDRPHGTWATLSR